MRGYEEQKCWKTGGCGTSSSSPGDPACRIGCDNRCRRDCHSKRLPRRRRRPSQDRYDLRQALLESLMLLLLFMAAAPSLLSPAARLPLLAATATTPVLVVLPPAAAAAPLVATHVPPTSGLSIPGSRSSDSSPLFSSGFPFLGERRLSSRTVTTKYGSLRGVTVSLPNRSLQPIEVFLGKNIAHSPSD